MLAGIGEVQAQDYPTKTVTVIVPFAAGGPADVTGRIVADIFTRHLGQQFVVENVGGAGGTVGSLARARAAATATRSSRPYGHACGGAVLLSQSRL
jgi:tripartite-type tricarboxylate transporter receptor subunit TctC